MISHFIHLLRPKFFCCYVALSRPTVKMRKNRVRFFFFFLCQIWAKNLLKFVFNGLKKHLHDLYMRFDCILPEFSPFRNFKKILENSVLSRYVKKKKKKSRPTDPIFKFWSGEGNITIFFFGLISMWLLLLVSTLHTVVVARLGKLRQALRFVKNNLLLTEYAWNLNT